MAPLFTPAEHSKWCLAASESYEDFSGFLEMFKAEVARRVVRELRPVFEAAVKSDPRLVEYHARRFGAELVPIYATEVE
jgi:hypothetical protein